MIWEIAGHEVAVTGAGLAYEDTYGPFMMLVCHSCWAGTTTGSHVLWKDVEELNPLEERIEVDYSAALRALSRHLGQVAELDAEVVGAAVTMACLADDLWAGIDILSEQASQGAE